MDGARERRWGPPEPTFTASKRRILVGVYQRVCGD